MGVVSGGFEMWYGMFLTENQNKGGRCLRSGVNDEGGVRGQDGDVGLPDCC